MGQALYRKYRSKNLDEIVGQKPVTTALKNALKSGQISHAYLFTGPRGVGKTSVARILAHEINGLPYESDELPLDIIEIDAASNRRIDEIRDLREKVRIAPVSAKYKVYIIDEVHMLTREAFNALLKTLEEPPAHVIFILATTEAHKLPETIVSRTQRYSFKLASAQDVAGHLKSVAELETITISEEALELLARHSGGSLRDALSLLDQVRHSAKKVDAAIVRQNLGLPSADVVKTLLIAVQSNDPKEVVNALEQARDDGVSATLIAEQLLQTLRASFINGSNGLNPEEALSLAQSLLAVEASARPDIQLEIALLGLQIARQDSGKSSTSAARIPENQPALTISKPAVRPPKKSEAQLQKQPATAAPEQTASDGAMPKDLSSELWQQTLDSIRQTHNTIYSILRMAQPDFSQLQSKQFVLKFQFPFHQKRINEGRNKQVILQSLSNLGVNGYEVVCDLLPKERLAVSADSTPDLPDYQPAPQSENILLHQIQSVFGGAEVLE